MSNPTITIITTPNGDHRWIANSDEEVAHFSLPGQGHKIEIYTRVAPIEAAAMAATVPADLLCYLKNLTIGTFNRHYAHDETYASGQAIWAPCDDMAGLLTQLDNMLTGLSRTPVADQPAEPYPKQVGLFSVGVDGHLCFHMGHTNPEGLCRTLDEGVTGGPYRARIAYAGHILAPKGDSNG